MTLYKGLCRFFCLVFLTSSSAVSAQSDVSFEDSGRLIELQHSKAEDVEIHRRIENIFSKISGIEGVEVVVESGVVKLTGEVANETFAQEAKNIALRTASVVTVEDKIQRTLDVRGNVTPALQRLRDNLNVFRRALPLIAFSLLIFLIFVIVGGRIASWRKLWRKVAPNPFLAELLSRSVHIGMFIAGGIIALNLLGATRFIATLMGGIGVLGIAIGFAVRDSMENFISSIMLSLRQPFRSQDHVKINEHEGIVIRLTSRATILMTLAGNHLRIPNSVVFKGIILNYTTNPERRFEFELGVDADDDPLAALQVGLSAIKSHDFVLTDPAPGALIKNVGDSNIVIKFTAWVNQSKTNFAKARSLAIKSVMSELNQSGFTMPEPIYRLRFDDALPQTQPTPKAKASHAAPAISPQTFDVSPSTHLTQKVNEERAQDSGEDLLDDNRPKE